MFSERLLLVLSIYVLPSVQFSSVAQRTFKNTIFAFKQEDAYTLKEVRLENPQI